MLRGRDDFADAPRWEELASARRVRLPAWSLTCTPARMEKWLRKLGISTSAYYAWSGTTALRQFAALNPSWPLAAWLGLLMEKQARGNFDATT